MSKERKPTLAEHLELGISVLMRYLPIGWTSSIGAYFGTRFARNGIAAGRKWIKRLHHNIERLNGVTDPATRQARIIDYARQVGRVYAEFAVQQRIVAAGRLEVVGREHLENLSRPAIFVSGHLANWELVGHLHTLMANAGCALYDPPESPIRHRLAIRARSAWRSDSQLVAASSKALFQIAKALHAGCNLLIYVDEQRDGYIWAPSLGRQIPYAGNRWLASRLAVRHQADIVPVHIERIGDDCFRVIIEAKLLPGEGSEDQRARFLADQIDQRLETWIRARPEHWYWLAMLDLDKPAPLPDRAVL